MRADEFSKLKNSYDFHLINLDVYLLNSIAVVMVWES